MFTVQLGKEQIEKELLRRDKKTCKKYGPCGVGKEALYLNSFYIDRKYYVPLSSVTRAFKRVAMSKGGFSKKGMFVSVPYLVVVYDDGKEKQCVFRHEEQVDMMLAQIKKVAPHIRLFSEEGEARLEKRRKEKEAEKKSYPVLTKEEQQEVDRLRKIQNFLERKPEIFTELTEASKSKRTFERSNPSYKWVALVISLMGCIAIVYGLYSLLQQASFAVYFLIFGLAAVFIFAAFSVMPTARSNKKSVEERLKKAMGAVERYVKDYPEFPVPARYAHPITVKRMKDAIIRGKAKDATEALQVVKDDLKNANASVEVEQEEYDEIMAIKPLFLLWKYE